MCVCVYMCVCVCVNDICNIWEIPYRIIQASAPRPSEFNLLWTLVKYTEVREKSKTWEVQESYFFSRSELGSHTKK